MTQSVTSDAKKRHFPATTATSTGGRPRRAGWLRRPATRASRNAASRLSSDDNNARLTPSSAAAFVSCHPQVARALMMRRWVSSAWRCRSSVSVMRQNRCAGRANAPARGEIGFFSPSWCTAKAAGTQKPALPSQDTRHASCRDRPPALQWQLWGTRLVQVARASQDTWVGGGGG